MSVTVYCLDIAFYFHISTDRKYDNMIMVIMQGYRCKGKVKRLVSSQWVFLLMGVVHWLDESAPKIAKRYLCRGACVVYNAVGLWHCFKPCWCCLIAVLDVLFENLLLEFCCIILVFGLLLFPWQFLPLYQMGCLSLCQAALAGGAPLHFTIPLVEVKTKKIAGYVPGDFFCLHFNKWKGEV